MKKDDKTLDPLDAVLRDLPRARAGEDFTDRLLERLERRDGERSRGTTLPWGRLAAAAVGLLAVALTLVFVESDRPRHTAAEQAEIRRLLEQHRQLEEDLAAVRRQVREADPILYLEGLPTQGGHSLDLVVEMPAQVRPAAYRLD